MSVVYQNIPKRHLHVRPDPYLKQGEFLLKLTSLGLMALNGQIKEEATKMTSKEWAGYKISQSDNISTNSTNLSKH